LPRVEGFLFGVLEMLVAVVPVIAYDAPGPHVMLPPEYSVPVGVVGDLADRVCDLLTDPDRLRVARRATASKIPVILAVLDGNLVCSYNVYY